MRAGSNPTSWSSSDMCGFRVCQQIRPITTALISDLPKATQESRPNTRPKPLNSDSLEMSGLILSGAHRKPVCTKLAKTPAAAAALMTMAKIGSQAMMAMRATSTAPLFCRTKESGWAMNGSRLDIRFWASQPPIMNTTPATALSVAHCGTSMLLATSPWRRASSRRRLVGSSVFDSGSVSAMPQSYEN